MPLQYALTEYRSDKEKLLALLSGLNRAAEVSPMIAGFMESGEMFHPLRLTSGEAFSFLKDIEKRERVIVFTQFKEITEYLADYLTGMKNYWDDGELYSQPSKSLLKRNASDSLKKQKMKGKTMHPIIISGRKIARSWWGNAWCENLERYADYASRLERGKRYVRTGTVVDLQIEKGRIQARVQGRRKAPDGCHIFRL